MLKKALVGEEVVPDMSNINRLQEGAGEIAPLNCNGYFERRPHPTPTRKTPDRFASIAGGRL